MEKSGVKVSARCTDAKKAFSTARTDHLEQTCAPKRSALRSAGGSSRLGGGGGGGDAGVEASVPLPTVAAAAADAPVAAAAAAGAAGCAART